MAEIKLSRHRCLLPKLLCRVLCALGFHRQIGWCPCCGWRCDA